MRGHVTLLRRYQRTMIESQCVLIATTMDGLQSERLLISAWTCGDEPIRLEMVSDWQSSTRHIVLSHLSTLRWPKQERQSVTRSVLQKSLRLREEVRSYALSMPIRSAERALKLFYDVGNHIVGNTAREWAASKDSWLTCQPLPYAHNLHGPITYESQNREFSRLMRIFSANFWSQSRGRRQVILLYLDSLMKAGAIWSNGV